jgi:hypothetical protein
MMGNYHVQFGSGGGEGDFFANHNHQQLSHARHAGAPCTPAMAAGLTDHIWSIAEVLTFKVAPAPWVAPKRAYNRREPNRPKRPRGRPRIHPLPDPMLPKRPRGRPRKAV